jgi:hypothetical protein
MWLITPVGFFSIVRKPGDLAAGALTIRARAPREQVAQVFAAMLQDIAYGNFKNEVAVRQGRSRAETYGKVWSILHGLSGRPG